MDVDLVWANRFNLDIQFGYVESETVSPGLYNPRLVLNRRGSTVEHSIVEELARSSSFTFSVAFVSAGAIAQLKQHLREFKGDGHIITSDFLGFNEPRAFAELLNLREQLGIDVRRHPAKGFHAKGYVFQRSRSVTAMIGSSNLTSSALSQNHEWNIKVSAARGSDLADQLEGLLDEQLAVSEPLTQEWIDEYSATYTTPVRRAPLPLQTSGTSSSSAELLPNLMQQDALLALDLARAEGAERAIIISATGTGKTLLSAFDVRAVNPERFLFVAHREQILDRTIQEYQRVLGGTASDYGKLTGSHREQNRRYVFATIQSLSQQSNLDAIAPDAFEYVIVDEAHRSGADSYQRVIEGLQPKFLLGMTATPERTDGFNVFELFHYNVPYEIRLNDALEAAMLCPFHYYGIADVTYEDSTTISDETELSLLVSPDRINYLIEAIELYGQSGVDPRGLIFCSRKDEARQLSEALNMHSLRGKPLRTIVLTGEDSIDVRERGVAQLESAELDYIFTVDIFNEGVDIPSLNQVIMLRQTQSAIVFVQQLGRGLRLAENKDYLVVIDFIGNYSNNFLIPIALFGDESLNRESLRERLNETVDAGALPGLSSVSFDEISRERILSSIATSTLDSMSNLKIALVAMKNRVGGTPALWDFYRFKSVDPILLATKKEHYPALAASLLRVKSQLTPGESRALSLVSHEVLPAKRLHEFVLLDLLLEFGSVTTQTILSAFEAAGIAADSSHVASAIDTLALRGYPKSDVTKYQKGIAEQIGDSVQLTQAFAASVFQSAELAAAIADLTRTGKQLTRDRYSTNMPFTPGLLYSRRDVAHILGWSRSNYSTMYGYKSDLASGACPLFVTLHKSEDIEASTAYKDQLIDQSTMRWFSKSNRTLASKDVREIVNGLVELQVFVKKDDADGPDHYYLGRAIAHDPIETTMPNSKGHPLPVVSMTLKFDSPIQQGLFDYFHPLDHE